MTQPHICTYAYRITAETTYGREYHRELLVSAAELECARFDLRAEVAEEAKRQLDEYIDALGERSHVAHYRDEWRPIYERDRSEP